MADKGLCSANGQSNIGDIEACCAEIADGCDKTMGCCCDSSCFKTPRVIACSADEWLQSCGDASLVVSIPQLLTPDVVKELPPYFHDIDCNDKAKAWLEKMTAESQLFVLQSLESHSIIGFIFLYDADDGSAHIGYLLGESYWGKGLAGECIKGLIDWCADNMGYEQLIGGVARNNIASVRLLQKLGFSQVSSAQDVDFYHYHFS